MSKLCCIVLILVIFVYGSHGQNDGRYRAPTTVKSRINDGRYSGGSDGRYRGGNGGKYSGANDGRYIPDDGGKYSHIAVGGGQYTGGGGQYTGGGGQYTGSGGQYLGGGGGGSGGGSGGGAGGESGLRDGSGSATARIPTTKPTTRTTQTPRPTISIGSGTGVEGWKIVRDIKEEDQDGYHYLYETENKILAEESGRIEQLTSNDQGLRSQGFYEYVGDDGLLYRVDYVADDNGFVPRGDHIPTTPPEIVKLLAHLATKKPETKK